MVAVWVVFVEANWQMLAVCWVEADGLGIASRRGM